MEENIRIMILMFGYYIQLLLSEFYFKHDDKKTAKELLTIALKLVLRLPWASTSAKDRFLQSAKQEDTDLIINRYHKVSH